MLEKFPGFLNYGGIIAIHADWPIYPPGIGWEIALRNFASFPLGTEFFEISDIDRGKLFLDKNPKNVKDPFDYQNYHVAVWHEDILGLKRRGLVKGVFEASDYEFDLYQFNQLKISLGKHLQLDADENVMLYLSKDKPQTIPKPKPLPDDEDDFLVENNCALTPTSISLTEEAFEKVVEFSQSCAFHFDLQLTLRTSCPLRRKLRSNLRLKTILERRRLRRRRSKKGFSAPCRRQSRLQGAEKKGA